MKTEERRQARELRAQGMSIGDIQEQLGVSRSSVSLWVRDVVLRPEQRERLVDRIRLGPMMAGELKAERARELRRKYQHEGRRLARDCGADYIAGCMLYWAEGAKARNTVKVINADPEILVCFTQFLRRYFEVPNEKMRVYCNLFADHVARQREIEDYWLALLDLPRSCLRKTMLNTYSKYSQKKRQNKLPFGTTALVVHSTRIVQTIYGSIQEYGGFERPEWLD